VLSVVSVFPRSCFSSPHGLCIFQPHGEAEHPMVRISLRMQINKALGLSLTWQLFSYPGEPGISIATRQSPWYGAGWTEARCNLLPTTTPPRPFIDGQCLSYNLMWAYCPDWAC
jgi:hypothetical protein